MYLVGQVCDSVLLLYVKCALVHAIRLNSFAQLSSCHMMKHHALLTGIDHFTIVKSLKLLSQLCLLCQLRESCQHLIVYLLGSIVKSKACCHRNTVLFHTVCTVGSGHNLCQIYTCHFGKFLIRINRIQILPGNHC